jgi:hypothetical protein
MLCGIGRSVVRKRVTDVSEELVSIFKVSVVKEVYASIFVKHLPFHTSDYPVRFESTRTALKHSNTAKFNYS